MSIATSAYHPNIANISNQLSGVRMKVLRISLWSIISVGTPASRASLSAFTPSSSSSFSWGFWGWLARQNVRFGSRACGATEEKGDPYVLVHGVQRVRAPRGRKTAKTTNATELWRHHVTRNNTRARASQGPPSKTIPCPLSTYLLFLFQTPPDRWLHPL